MSREVEAEEAPNADLPMVRVGPEEEAKYAASEARANRVSFAELCLHLEKVRVVPYHITYRCISWS